MQEVHARRGPRLEDDLLGRSNLSTSQYLLWLGQRLHPRSPLYDMVLAFDMAGPLDARRFDRAFVDLAARSDALRTIIDEVDGVPVQRVRADVPVISHVDLSGEAEPEAALRAFLDRGAEKVFDLRESLLDTALIRLGPERHVWFLNQHHLITDGWATTLVYRHVAELYERGARDDGPALPQYSAYVEYERRFRDTPLFRRVRDHWQHAIDTAAGPVRLYGRSGGHGSTRTERQTIDLGTERSARIRASAADSGAGMLTGDAARFVLFATALFAFLSRVSGQRRLAIGAPSHNRASAALKETIGPLIELFPISVDIDESDTFRTLLGKVRSGTQSFLRYAQPGASSAPLMRGFNVVLNYIHATFPSFAGLSMRSEWVHSGHGDPGHHLRLQVHDFDAADRFVLHFDLRRDLFDATTRDTAQRHFLRVLDALLADPDQVIAGVDLGEPVEVAPPEPARPSDDAEATVVAMILGQAERTPDAVALSCGAGDVTYAELIARSGNLARELRARGATTECRVGIHLERSVEAVTAILGVLRAGAAWVPLPTDEPDARRRFVVQDAGVRWIVTDATRAGRVAGLEVDVVRMDEAASSGEDPHAATMPLPSPAHAAYVLYTSGSTGRPKGVVVEHGSLTAYIRWARDVYLRGRALDFPLFTSLGFDLTLTSLFLPLVAGGRVVIYGEEGGGGAAALLRVLEEDRVDALKLTPSHLPILARAVRPPSRIRILIVGGEDLKTAQARQALDALGEVEIFNEYGPTEATVGCMIHRWDPARDTGASVPIGKAAASASIHLLDGGLRPVPAGVTGEICVAGPGVARGYLGRPELTAERFVEDPRRPGRRLYRTGDLGRARGDGIMEYLGRADGQVKVRGARIETAEVEAALLAHPAIDACAVEVVTDGSPPTDASVVHCARCGLPSTWPGASFDSAGICHLCRGFGAYAERVKRYFRSMDDLRTLLAPGTRGDGAYDCVMLLSGGKDSTYALCRLVDMGARVLAFTLDNGYLSDGAKANITRVTESLGVDHVFGSTPAMNAIFVDSLKRHSNVCNGCFKTVYTLGARLARERGIPIVVTGLSRGQFFETRLTEELFRDDTIDADRIDRVILEARKAYHRTDDAVARLLDTRDFADDRLFDEVRFVDFYRYCDVGLDEMLRYLAEHVPWIRPEDTGRSTNCLINDVGIFVHRRERGFHNYAFPYSWDVRVGHKTRAAALNELNDEPDPRAVRRILGEIGYPDPLPGDAAGEPRLTVWYAAREPLDTSTLRRHLERTLPAWMLPDRFVQVDALPLTANGKVDQAALRALGASPSLDTNAHVAPRSPLEDRIAGIWADVLGVERVGVLDPFLDRGGTSLAAIRIISRVNEAFGIDLPLQSAFEASTVAALARLVEDVLVRDVARLSDAEAEALAADTGAPRPVGS